MKQTTYWRRLVWYLMVALTLALPFSLASPSSVAAQSLGEYFQISYAASFSKSAIYGSEVFYVTINGKATCIKDLPPLVSSVSEASITSRIVARHTATGTVVTLNPSYTVTIKPFPSKTGDITEMTQTVSLQFPAQAQSGSYDVTGELIKAEVKVLFLSKEVTSYLPQSQSIGSLEYTSATAAPAGGGGGGAAPPPSPTIETNLFGKTSSFRTTATGTTLEKIEATSQDRVLGISIPQDTVTLDKDSKPLKTLEATIKESPPEPPRDTSIVGPAYNLGPDGATFAPPIMLTWTYNREALPQGIEEKQLFIAFWDASRWVALESKVDTDAHTVSARTSHFSQFALIGKLPPPLPPPAGLSISSLSIIPSEVNPTEPVTISTVVTNTGTANQSHTVILEINGLEEAREKVDIGAGSQQKIDFTVTMNVAGIYQVSVDGQSGTFTVKAVVPATSTVKAPMPATFAASSLTITPTEVEPGGTVTISVVITNTGALTGSHEVTFKVDEAVIATRTITLAAGASQPVSITTTRNAAGSYIVNVNGLSGTFTIKAAVINISAKPTNWWLVGGAIVGCAIVGVATWLVVRRRRPA